MNPYLFAHATPYLLILGWSIYRKATSRTWFRSAMIGLSFSVTPLIFGLIRSCGTFPGGADIGAGILIVFAPLLTIPFTILGIYLGTKFSWVKSLMVVASPLALTAGFATLWVKKVEIDHSLLLEKSRLDCTKMQYHCAIRDGKISEIPALKARGADIESKDGWGKTALLYSIHDPVAVKTLLKNGADPNAADAGGSTPLSVSLVEISQPNLEIALALLRAGADPNRKYGKMSKQMTLLTEAISSKRFALIEFLLKNGADPSQKDGFGYDACGRKKLYQIRGIPALDAFCPGQ